jgi:hypothetical protein
MLGFSEKKSSYGVAGQSCSFFIPLTGSILKISVAYNMA